MSDFNLPISIGTYTFIEQIHVPGTVWRAVNKQAMDQHSEHSEQTSKQTDESTPNSDESPIVSIFIISKDNINSQKQQTIFASEIALMKQMNENPYIAHFYEFCEDESYYYIVLDDIPQSNHGENDENDCMSLSEYIKQKGRISARAAKAFLSDLLNFFSYFESNPTLRNCQIQLTPDTIFVQEGKHSKKVKTSQSKQRKNSLKQNEEAEHDSNTHEESTEMIQSHSNPVLARHSHSQLSSMSLETDTSESDTDREKHKKKRSHRLKIAKVFVFGEHSNIIFSPPETVTSCSPPETINGNQAMTPPFTWLCGILLYFVLTGEFPFKGTTKAEVEMAILNDHFTFPPGVDSDCADLVQKLLVKNQVTRPPLTTIPNIMFIGQHVNEHDLDAMRVSLRSKRKSVPGYAYQQAIPQSKSVELSLKDIENDQVKSTTYIDSQENIDPIRNDSSASKSHKIPICKNNSSMHMPVGNKVRLTPRKNFMGLGKQLSLTLTKPKPNS